MRSGVPYHHPSLGLLTVGMWAPLHFPVVTQALQEPPSVVIPTCFRVSNMQTVTNPRQYVLSQGSLRHTGIFHSITSALGQSFPRQVGACSALRATKNGDVCVDGNPMDPGPNPRVPQMPGALGAPLQLPATTNTSKHPSHGSHTSVISTWQQTRDTLLLCHFK